MLPCWSQQSYFQCEWGYTVTVILPKNSESLRLQTLRDPFLYGQKDCGYQCGEREGRLQCWSSSGSFDEFIGIERFNFFRTLPFWMNIYEPVNDSKFTH